MIQLILKITLRIYYRFADAWPGKYNLLDETLELPNDVGFYVIDDLIASVDGFATFSQAVSVSDLQLATNYLFIK